MCTYSFTIAAMIRTIAKLASPSARSTDRGKTFVNYSWAETPFSSEVPAFLGDYTWLTAYDRKVYGTWTEALPVTEATSKPGSRPRPETAVRVGFADFSDSQ